MHPRKVENCSNCTDQVIFRDSILETKRIKQLLLLFQSPHHCSPPTRIASEQGNHCSLESPKSFATRSAKRRPEQVQQRPASSPHATPTTERATPYSDRTVHRLDRTSFA